MALHTIIVYKTWHAGGFQIFYFTHEGKHLKLDALSAKECGEKIYEYARNKLPADAEFALMFPRELRGSLKVSETREDTLRIPVSESEAKKIVESYHFFKSGVGIKSRKDRRSRKKAIKLAHDARSKR